MPPEQRIAEARSFLQLDPALHIGPAALHGAADELARLVAKTEPSPDAEQRIAEACCSFLQHVINEGSSDPRTSEEVHAAARRQRSWNYTPCGGPDDREKG
jgi:hypothetical protein